MNPTDRTTRALDWIATHDTTVFLGGFALLLLVSFLGF